LKQKIAITSLASISPLGNHPEAIWHNYLSNKTLISTKEFNGQNQFVATIPTEIRKEIETLKQSNSKYKSLDETVLMAVLVSRQAIKNAGWNRGDAFGINIGSSRGATQLFEKYHKEFLETGKTVTLASPTTTLGNISSWVAHDLKFYNLFHGFTRRSQCRCLVAIRNGKTVFGWRKRSTIDCIHNCSNEGFENLC
jgi:3-oxoacyl-(acyl-carrier-protein) synthase